MSSKSSDQRRYEIRQAANQQSREVASKHGTTWIQEDLDYLMENFEHAKAQAVADALGRTVEACTQMYYMKPDRESQNRKQEQHTTKGMTPGQRRWERGFTDLSQLDW